MVTQFSKSNYFACTPTTLINWLPSYNIIMPNSVMYLCIIMENSCRKQSKHIHKHTLLVFGRDGSSALIRWQLYGNSMRCGTAGVLCNNFNIFWICVNCLIKRLNFGPNGDGDGDDARPGAAAGSDVYQKGQPVGRCTGCSVRKLALKSI